MFNILQKEISLVRAQGPADQWANDILLLKIETWVIVARNVPNAELAEQAVQHLGRCFGAGWYKYEAA